MAGGGESGAAALLLTFEDIALFFSPAEWQLLTPRQKDLYFETMTENYKAFMLVGGSPLTSSEVVAWFEENKRLDVPKPARSSEVPPPEISVNEALVPSVWEECPEQESPPGAICSPSKEDAACHGSPPEPKDTPQSSPAPHEERGQEEMQFAACGHSTAPLLPSFAPAFGQSPGNLQALEEKLFVCAWCKQQFKLQVNLEVHYRYCHQKKLKCMPGPAAHPWKQIQKPGLSGPDGKGSILAVSGSSPCARKLMPLFYQCSDCGKGFALKFSLCKHRQVMHGAGRGSCISPLSRSGAGGSRNPVLQSAMKKLCRCLECGERFVYKWQLSAHLQGHGERAGDRPLGHGKKLGSENSPPKREPVCAREGPRGHGKHHKACVGPATMRRKPREQPLYPCRECGKRFTKNYLLTHLAFHAGERYQCLLCEKVFNFRSGAERHKKYHQDCGGGTLCPQSGKEARPKDCLCLIKKIRIAPGSSLREGTDEPR